MAKLLNESLWEAKRAALQAPHMEPLTAFAGQIRAERPAEDQVPDFDPGDGGVSAEVLFVLEAPGPQAKATGFVSRDNPDLTARNLREYLEEAGIARERSLIRNIVPWYLGEEKGIRPATSTDIREGSAYLEQLLPLLPNLNAVVLVGKKAQAAFRKSGLTTSHPLHCSYHPSPRWVHRHPGNGPQIVAAFREVAARLNGKR